MSILISIDFLLSLSIILNMNEKAFIEFSKIEFTFKLIQSKSDWNNRSDFKRTNEDVFHTNQKLRLYRGNLLYLMIDIYVLNGQIEHNIIFSL